MSSLATQVSIIDRMKKMGKTVVDAGAKTMLKVRSRSYLLKRKDSKEGVIIVLVCRCWKVLQYNAVYTLLDLSQATNKSWKSS